MRAQNEPLHPGLLLREWLCGADIAKFAELISLTEERLTEVFDAKVDVDADLASKISRALGTSQAVWLDLQAKYDARVSASKQKAKQSI